jgi:hypothetical protein
MKYKREVSRFQAKTDNGKTYTIIEYQEYTEVKTFDGQNEALPGLRELVTTDGLHVNYAAGVFRLVTTNEILHKVG